MPQTVDIRVERAAGLAEKHQTAAARHRQAAERATARGNTAKAQQERSLAERSERLAQEHTRFAERNTAGASRARAARSVNAAEILRRAEEAAATPDPMPLTPRQERAEAKRALMLERADAARTKDLRNAGVEADPRTAAGQRELVTSSARGVSGKRASLSGYGSLIQNPADRTGPRLKAMEVFDELSHRAFAGLLPEPRFERGVDVSKTLSGVADSRADALMEMSRLAARVGDVSQALLFFRVFERRRFTAMRDLGMGDERTLATLFLAAVDGVARHYGFATTHRAVEAMNERLSAA
ncbi:hypothetical protein PUR29_32905 [Methylobacterium ajmalii]|uniref:Uncharacterized protein n=1 Tax=Methylobacterium ajmalii TaxID=2738439 RepID=A0ABV0A341_9HYPH